MPTQEEIKGIKWFFNVWIVKHLFKWVIFIISMAMAWGGWFLGFNKKTGEFGCSAAGIKKNVQVGPGSTSQPPIPGASQPTTPAKLPNIK